LVAAHPEADGFAALERIDDPAPRLGLFVVDLEARSRQPIAIEAALTEALVRAWDDRAAVVALLSESAAAGSLATFGFRWTEALGDGDQLSAESRRYRIRRTRLTLSDAEAEVELARLPQQRPSHIQWVGTRGGTIAGVELSYDGGLRAREALRVVPRRSVALLLSQHGFAAHRRGEHGRALELWQQALELDPTSATTLYNLACVQALLGRPELALEHLERAIGSGGARFRQWARTDPDLATLWRRPEARRVLDTYERP
jgi:tetratricopeptide (TPR) repeat protein